MFESFDRRHLRFAVATVLYLLLVIWIGSFWLLLGIPVLFDIYVSGKVNWTFWKKRSGTNSTIIEWLDALIFAVIAVTLINIFLFQNYRIPTGSMEKSLLIGDHLFVSKMAYGPRLPNTPIAFPFTQHTMPLIGGKSWSGLIQWDYKRLAGFGDVKNNDPIVFNFPAGDTVVLEEQETSYYEILRRKARELRDRDSYGNSRVQPYENYLRLARREIWDRFNIVYRPVDKRDNYVKRCIAVPGDTVTIRMGVIFVNGAQLEEHESQQTTYVVGTNGSTINPKAFERLSVSRADQTMISGSAYILPLTRNSANTISKFSNVREVTPIFAREGEYAPHIFPHSGAYRWNEDNFGPLWIPARGVSVRIDTSNLCLYERIIDVYEDNTLRVEGSTIFINDIPSDSYTFKLDYYWMMGDNRHNSADSRYWGFVPEDHVVGKPKFIWLSLDKEASGLKKIRLKRMFMKIR